MTNLGAVDVHVLCILPALSHLGPVLTVHIVVHTFVATLVTRHRTIGQHPAGVLLALVHAGPVGTVLVGVLAAGLHPGLLRWLGRGHLHCSASHLGVALALVQSVDLANVSVGEPVSLANGAGGGMFGHYGLLAPGLTINNVGTIIFI